MNPAEVRDLVEKIRAERGDPEAAHGMEDALHQSVLAAIADGTCDQPQECARIAMTTRDIDFSRWYA